MNFTPSLLAQQAQGEVRSRYRRLPINDVVSLDGFRDGLGAIIPLAYLVQSQPHIHHGGKLLLLLSPP